MKDDEALQPVALVRHVADLVDGDVDLLPTDGVVAAGVVVGGVLLPGDQLVRVEELPGEARERKEPNQQQWHANTRSMHVFARFVSSVSAY